MSIFAQWHIMRNPRVLIHVEREQTLAMVLLTMEKVLFAYEVILILVMQKLDSLHG